MSAPEDIHALMASEADWLPFNGDAEAIAAVAARMIDGEHLIECGNSLKISGC